MLFRIHYGTLSKADMNICSDFTMVLSLLDPDCCLDLTYPCLEIYLTSVVWTFDTFQNNSDINHKFTKYLKKNCGLDLDQHFSIKYFLKIAFV